MKKAIINCLSSLIWFNKFSWIWFAQFSSWGCCLLTTPNNVWTLMLNGLPVLQIGCNAIFCVCDLQCQGLRWRGEWPPLSRHWTSSPRCPSQPSTPPHTPPPRSCSWLLWSEIIPNYQPTTCDNYTSHIILGIWNIRRRQFETKERSMSCSHSRHTVHVCCWFCILYILVFHPHIWERPTVLSEADVMYLKALHLDRFITV